MAGRVPDEAASCPCQSRHGERRARKQAAAPLAKLALAFRIQAGQVGARGPHTPRVRLPPLVEARVLEGRRHDGRSDLAQACRLEQLREVALAYTCQLRLIVDPWVELARRPPEDPERALAAGVIPDARGDHAIPPCHSRHLGESCDGVGHEMDDELGEGGVEGVVGEGQGLCRCLPHVNLRVALADSADERVGGVDGRDRRGPKPRHQLPREGAGATPDVKDSLAGLHHGEVRQLGREEPRIAAHESVVGLRRDVKHQWPGL